MEEIWKDVKGYEGLYIASNLGNIKGLKFKKILNSFDNGSGYLHLVLRKDLKSKNEYVHRLIADTFISREVGKDFVNHINGIKSDNRLENLEWCTRSENMNHAVSIGLSKHGEQHYKSKLTEENIKEILFSYEKPTVIAKRLNISYRHFREIKTGIKWNRTRIKLLALTEQKSI